MWKTTRLLRTQLKRILIDNRNPSLRDFIATQHVEQVDIPYLSTRQTSKRFYMEVYGCQMNTNDAEILASILSEAGYAKTERLEDASAIFLMTVCIHDAYRM
jgi:hypothetical protein